MYEVLGTETEDIGLLRQASFQMPQNLSLSLPLSPTFGFFVFTRRLPVRMFSHLAAELSNLIFVKVIAGVINVSNGVS